MNSDISPTGTDVITVILKSADKRVYSFDELGDFDYYLLDDELWALAVSTYLRGYPRWRVRLTRGFALGDYVLIKQSARIGLERLIKHEIGHTLGKGHTLLPTIMNPSWLFRWFDRL